MNDEYLFYIYNSSDETFSQSLKINIDSELVNQEF